MQNRRGRHARVAIDIHLESPDCANGREFNFLQPTLNLGTQQPAPRMLLGGSGG